MFRAWFTESATTTKTDRFAHLGSFFANGIVIDFRRILESAASNYFLRKQNQILSFTMLNFRNLRVVDAILIAFYSFG